jgi:hypothetical protein
MDRWRKLEARFDTKGRIELWKCSECSWVRQPPNVRARYTGPTPTTLRTYDAHRCEDFPKTTISGESIGCSLLLPPSELGPGNRSTS